MLVHFIWDWRAVYASNLVRCFQSCLLGAQDAPSIIDDTIGVVLSLSLLDIMQLFHYLDELFFGNSRIIHLAIKLLIWAYWVVCLSHSGDTPICKNKVLLRDVLYWLFECLFLAAQCIILHQGLLSWISREEIIVEMINNLLGCARGKSRLIWDPTRLLSRCQPTLCPDIAHRWRRFCCIIIDFITYFFALFVFSCLKGLWPIWSDLTSASLLSEPSTLQSPESTGALDSACINFVIHVWTTLTDQQAAPRHSTRSSSTMLAGVSVHHFFLPLTLVVNDFIDESLI